MTAPVVKVEILFKPSVVVKYVYISVYKTNSLVEIK